MNKIKVAQLVGYVGEHTAYHHGEQSLAQTIVGLAQTFVGSNNINILMPNGQFGTRHQGGKDAAIFSAKGLIYMEQGHFDEAVKILHEALAIHPQDPIATELLNKALDETAGILP